MPNLNDIPKPAYDELVELMGKEEAERFIKDVKYNYRSIMQRITYIRLKKILVEGRPIYKALVIIGIVLLLLALFRDFIFF